jgi:hypothetical protein
MSAVIELPPGDPGTPPHRHCGPAFGYMLEGEMTFEWEGEPERVIRAGEAFWVPGGDVIHYRSANHLQDSWSRFSIVLMCVPGLPVLTLVDMEELVERRHRRASGPGPDPAVTGPTAIRSERLDRRLRSAPAGRGEAS